MGNNFRILNSNTLKLIAVISMMIDHTAVALIENSILGHGQGNLPHMAVWRGADIAMRFTGRIAFPIFCFLLVEGFLHTRDVKKYAGRLFAFALISEIPFDLAAFNAWFDPAHQNVYVTLFLGLLAMAGIRRYEREGNRWGQAVVFTGCCLAAWLTRCDYGVFGVFFIVLLYMLRDDAPRQTLTGILCLLWEPGAILAFIPIRMYDGTRGSGRWKWFFYVFYPAHLLALALIRTALEGKLTG